MLHRSLSPILIFIFALLTVDMHSARADEPLSLTLRFQQESPPGSGEFRLVKRAETWKPQETAIIVCDVWDYHHSLNAVRRLEEFAPRLDRVLATARERGVTIIHSPSDCMPAYADHPARRRAVQAPAAKRQPYDVAAWCSALPSEQRGTYPIDQSDGGEDDEPEELAQWRKKLTELGRDPNLPWQRQSDLITIDAGRDFLSDRGDEVWNVLESRGIRNVILTGVHVNMCVLGRPFGLRQMARNGKHVVLMRDMTDAMYNPRQWPYVDHFTGNDLVISHIERYVCPTVTSDQILGGEPEPFRFSGDTRPQPASSIPEHPDDSSRTLTDYRRQWVNMPVPSDWESGSQGVLKEVDSPGWYRCVIRIPADWVQSRPLIIRLADALDVDGVQGWVNGEPLDTAEDQTLGIRPDAVVPDDHNLLVLRVSGPQHALRSAPVLHSSDGTRRLELAGRWQFRLGDDRSWSNMPLPAKFGGSADIVFSPEEPLWVARPLTRPGEFTSGIEGPACDREGNVYAVNYERQGTIGRITADGAGEVFVELPDGSIGNGIRFDARGMFYVADYTGHNVLRVDPGSREITLFAHNAAMNQPNDLAIADDGTLYASDPNWSESSGQLWRIDPDGTTTLLATDLGTTNGIDLSPDGRTLYVNESRQRNVWAFTITQEKSLTDKRLIRKFEDHGFDGMRTDVDGNLYITRYGQGTVVKMSPDGEILREIDVLGARPSNLCFGGPDGRTVYVTEVEFTRIVRFRVDRPGRSWKQLMAED